MRQALRKYLKDRHLPLCAPEPILLAIQKLI